MTDEQFSSIQIGNIDHTQSINKTSFFQKSGFNLPTDKDILNQNLADPSENYLDTHDNLF